jgi:hypothetical protein
MKTMALYKSMATAPSLEQEGVWLEIEGTRIRVARAGGTNTKYNKAMEHAAKNHKRVFDLGLMTNEKGLEILRTVFASTVVIDWLTKTETGNLDSEGNEIDGGGYERKIECADGSLCDVTPANIIQTFVNLQDLFFMVKDTAENMTYFRQSIIDDIVGN